MCSKIMCLSCSRLLLWNCRRHDSGNYIRDKPVEVLQHVQVVDGVLGEFAGYQQEQDVKPNLKKLKHL